MKVTIDVPPYSNQTPEKVWVVKQHPLSICYEIALRDAVRKCRKHMDKVPFVAYQVIIVGVEYPGKLTEREGKILWSNPKKC